MIKKAKIIAISGITLLTLALSVGMTGCGSSNTKSSTTEKPAATQKGATPLEQAKTIAESADKHIKEVGRIQREEAKKYYDSNPQLYGPMKGMAEGSMINTNVNTTPEQREACRKALADIKEKVKTESNAFTADTQKLMDLKEQNKFDQNIVNTIDQYNATLAHTNWEQDTIEASEHKLS